MPTLDISRTMFGLYNLYKYLLLLICSPFGFICSEAVLEEEGMMICEW